MISAQYRVQFYTFAALSVLSFLFGIFCSYITTTTTSYRITFSSPANTSFLSMFLSCFSGIVCYEFYAASNSNYSFFESMRWIVNSYTSIGAGCCFLLSGISWSLNPVPDFLAALFCVLNLAPLTYIAIMDFNRANLTLSLKQQLIQRSS